MRVEIVKKLNGGFYFMDINTLPDRISTLIVVLIAILGIISSRIPDIQNAVNSIPQQYQLPAFIIAVLATLAVSAWSFYTSEQRSKNSYDHGLYEPVPPDTAGNTESSNKSTAEVQTEDTQDLE